MNVTEFLKNTALDPDLTDIRQTAAIFRREMKNGLENQPSSLKMIPSYIGDDYQISPQEYVIAIDAGGTNLRINLVQFDKNLIPQIIEAKHYPMPGTQGEIDCDELFNFLALEIKDYLHKTTLIGFCFSYAVEILPSQDGKILGLGKEVYIRDIQGKCIGDELRKALVRNQCPDFSHLTVVNDTTAALIAGQNLLGKPYSDYIGYILGTGVNMCYYEKDKAILKDPILREKTSRCIINLESGYFDGMIRGEVDEALWAITSDPDGHHMEKMISGQYLGTITTRFLREAAKQELFTPSGAQLILSMDELTTPQLSGYMDGEHYDQSPFARLSEPDEQIALAITEAVLDRAARLVCASLLGTLLQLDPPADKPVMVLMEGSTYSKFSVLRKKIQALIESEINASCPFSVSVQQIDNAVTLGTAFAATNHFV